MRVLKVIILKTIVGLLNLLRPGSGTALPGLLAEKYAPELFSQYCSQLEKVILITGTNGKTTTRNLLSAIFDQAEVKHFSNKEGSNMKRGIISTFLKNSTLLGKLKKKIAIFEVEEATLPRIVGDLKPEVLIVTNLFRDQLDAYGEVNTTQRYIRQAIEASPNIKLVLNADDPLVRELAENIDLNRINYFSLEKQSRGKFNYEGDESKMGELKEAVKATSIEVTKRLDTKFQVNHINYKLNLPGVFHVYNALAAIQVAKNMKVSQKVIQDAFDGFEPAFGRGEQLGKFKILLIKNPAGFTLTLDMLKNAKDVNLLLILNDKIADGRDVSWIWDGEVEKVNEIGPKKIYISGTRAEDMALRVKYALGFKKSQEQSLMIEKNLKKMVELIETELEKDEIVFVLPTYTAMNEFRKVLGQKF